MTRKIETTTDIDTSTHEGSKRIGKLTVVGAGPGDVELITLKAIKVLKAANVVLYDALVDTSLLEYAPDAEHIFVGKRKGCYAYQQDQINELIVSRALTHGHVVRLKGGDPFVFGRGAEEMEYAASKGLKVAMVPGISSSMAVPASQNIPVTKRGASESFWVITGTTKDHKLSAEVALAAKSSATVVILMGMSKLSEIVDLFKEEGKIELPIAIIQNGTCKNEKVGMGTIGTIKDIVAKKELSNPAIIIIGEVVRHRSIVMEHAQNIISNSQHQQDSAKDALDYAALLA
ncbi:uroporphyrinogen-III C-methyltransferase [Arenibacter certesii]|uniref:uroporphyrinogen-III C-methyltransferase n=1 Tax=Arenibacter certesii TaxID=228955 RepID=A0A918MNW2_9FLAO|nr:uroporphyrinogen-III C-methyltransferase [Arenibacter certesii]GGW39858.1 uroporphyrinogen-III C-methyltransferase [Arenibacter certesii]